MQIVEVKNDIAKINYNSANNHLLPSDFVLIEDNFLKFIAQVINIETTQDSVINSAYLRLSLFIDSEDNLSFYNGYIIGKNAKVNYISAEEIVELISDDKHNIYFGNLANHKDVFVKTSMSFIDDKLYIQSDKNDKVKIIVQNLASQLVAKNKKVVILDFDNQFRKTPDSICLKFNQDIKLPLNVQALDNLIEQDIQDCPIDDRAFIQGIILELREYIKTIPDKFLQFSLFRDVINSQYQENPISGLMILRNKLWLYAQNNIFADSVEHFQKINSVIEENNCVVIDASDIDEKWQKFVIQTLYQLISEKCYLFMSLDGFETNKKFINEIYSKENIIPIVSSSYSNNCRSLLGLLSANQILCKALNNIDENIQYIEYLNKLNQEEFIVFGEATLYLPLVLSLQQFDASTFNNVLEHDIKRDVDKLLSNNSNQIPQNVGFVEVKEPLQQEENNPVQDVSVVEQILDNDLDEIEEVLQEEVVEDEIVLEDTVEEIQPIEEVQPVEEIQSVEQVQNVQQDVYDDDLTSSDLDFLDEILAGDEQVEEFDNQLEELQNPVEIQPEEEIVVLEEKPVVAQQEEQIEDIEDDLFLEDEVQTEGQEVIETIQDEVVSVEEYTSQEVLREVDDIIDEIDTVDMIDDIEVQDEEEIQPVEEQVEYEEEIQPVDEQIEYEEEVEETYIEEAEKVEEQEHSEKYIEEELIEINEDIVEKQNPNLKVYETDIPKKINMEDLPFEVGDKVYHPKHGIGIVRGFTNYSDKNLFCHVEFENVGRRLLDPSIAQLEKV